WKLLPALQGQMGLSYPELIRAGTLITDTLRLEEERFQTTLARGLAILEEETRHLTAGQTLAGEVAFKLYDTYGFPLDLTQDALGMGHIQVDVRGFQQAMEHQKTEARKTWVGSGETAAEAIWFGLKDRLGATEFLGYETEQAQGVVTAIVANGQEVA